MKIITQITSCAILAFSLAACSGGQESAETGSAAPSEMDHASMDHSGMSEGTMSGDTGHTTGVIISISEDGQQATIDHGDIEGVGMGAMTMGFGILSRVDLANYEAGDNVSFMVKKGRDGSYRIAAICNMDTEGADCLDAQMDHSGH